MAWVISAVHLNYTGIKFQVEQCGNYFIISEFIKKIMKKRFSKLIFLCSF